jgi:hypothetical protein
MKQEIQGMFQEYRQMHSSENREKANIKFPYEIEVSNYIDYIPLTNYIIDSFNGSFLSSKPIYFPKYVFSDSTAKIVYLSNYINALTFMVQNNFDENKYRLLMATFIELFTLVKMYIQNEDEKNLVTKKNIIRALKPKQKEYRIAQDLFRNVEKDNLLLNNKYLITSTNYQ